MSRGTRHDLFAQRGVCTCVTVELGLDRHQGSVAFCSELYTDLSRVALGMHEQALVSVVEDLDRSPSFLRKQRGVNLTCDVLLASKSTPDEGADDSYLLVRHAQAACDLAAIGVRYLGPDIDLDASLIREPRDGTFGFEEGVLCDGRVIGVLENDVSFFKPRLEITLPHLNVFEQVAVFMDIGGVCLTRLNRVRNHRQVFILRLNQI